MSNQPHVLVVDDEPQILRALRTILTEKGYRVSTASSGEEGLALAAATLPDVVILDLGLPDMDGADVCARRYELIDERAPDVAGCARDKNCVHATKDEATSGKVTCRACNFSPGCVVVVA